MLGQDLGAYGYTSCAWIHPWSFRVPSPPHEDEGLSEQVRYTYRLYKFCNRPEPSGRKGVKRLLKNNAESIEGIREERRDRGLLRERRNPTLSINVKVENVDAVGRCESERLREDSGGKTSQTALQVVRIRDKESCNMADRDHFDGVIRTPVQSVSETT